LAQAVSTSERVGCICGQRFCALSPAMMYYDMTSYSTGGSGAAWPQDASQNWYSSVQDQGQGNWNSLWGSEKPWGGNQNQELVWGEQLKPQWNSYEKYGRQDDYSEYNAEYNNYQAPLNSRLVRQASTQLCNLAEEPNEVLVVNSVSSGAYRTLLSDAAAADVVGFDAEWAPDHQYGSDNPISVLQLAFPISRRVYVIQLSRLDNKLPSEVQMMLVNPEVHKIGFAVDLNDRAKMARSGIAFTKGSITDVQGHCAATLGFINNLSSLSLRNAAFGLLNFNLNKDKRISCSDWACKELSPEQVKYAAMDAWVPLRLCYQLS